MGKEISVLGSVLCNDRRAHTKSMVFKIMADETAGVEVLHVSISLRRPCRPFHPPYRGLADLHRTDRHQFRFDFGGNCIGMEPLARQRHHAVVNGSNGRRFGK